MKISYGLHMSTFGVCAIGVAANQVCYLSFLDTSKEGEVLKSLKVLWPEATYTRDDKKAALYIKKIFSDKRQSFKLLVKGTDFQMKVWETLLRIPEGKIATYADVAKEIGSPKAVRAVGTACGKNNIGFLIPCHRVLASSGGLGGYRWGIGRKKAMLASELGQA